MHNNNEFGRDSIRDIILLQELRNLCDMEYNLHIQIFLDNDYGLVDQVWTALNSFDNIEDAKYKIVHLEAIIGILAYDYL